MKRWIKIKMTVYEMRRGRFIKAVGLMICTKGAMLRLWHSLEKRGLIVEGKYEREYKTSEVRAMGYDVKVRCHFLMPLTSELL